MHAYDLAQVDVKKADWGGAQVKINGICVIGEFLFLLLRDPHKIVKLSIESTLVRYVYQKQFGKSMGDLIVFGSKIYLKQDDADSKITVVDPETLQTTFVSPGRIVKSLGCNSRSLFVGSDKLVLEMQPNGNGVLEVVRSHVIGLVAIRIQANNQCFVVDDWDKFEMISLGKSSLASTDWAKSIAKGQIVRGLSDSLLAVRTIDRKSLQLYDNELKYIRFLECDGMIKEVIFGNDDLMYVGTDSQLRIYKGLELITQLPGKASFVALGDNLIVTASYHPPILTVYGINEGPKHELPVSVSVIEDPSVSVSVTEEPPVSVNVTKEPVQETKAIESSGHSIFGKFAKKHKLVEKQVIEQFHHDKDEHDVEIENLLAQLTFKEQLLKDRDETIEKLFKDLSESRLENANIIAGQKSQLENLKRQWKKPQSKVEILTHYCPKIFHPNQVSMSFNILGVGSIGLVVEGLLNGEKVAIKQVSNPQEMSGKQSEDYRSEAGLMAAVRHPYVIPLLGVLPTEESDLFNLVLPRMTFNLKGYYMKRKDGLSAKIEIMRKVANGMVYLHRHGIIHRDLKPQNILVDEKGDPQISDFGLARVSTGTVDSVNSAGTMYYMPPECFMEGTISKAGDVYAFGIILSELMLEKIPFNTNIPAMAFPTVMVQGNAQFEMPDEPKKVRSLIEICVQKDRSKRPSFEEIEAVLKGIK